MPLISDRRTESDELPRALFGDDKIKAGLREVLEIRTRISELCEAIRRARFVEDPPNNESVRAHIQELLALPDSLRLAARDLKYYTDLMPADEALGERSARRRVSELETQSEE